MGKLAVGWHKDPTEPASSVGVYQCSTNEQDDLQSWSVGFRVDSDAQVPALQVQIQSGDFCFMLDNFNDTHYHCVVAGSTKRFSSTHKKSKGSLFVLKCFV